MADGDRLIDVIVGGPVLTTDATVTTLMTYTPPDETTVQIEFFAIGQQSNGTRTSTENGVALIRRDGSVVNRIGGSGRNFGTISIGSAYNILNDDNSNTEFRITVQGTAAENVTWVGVLEIVTIEEAQ